MKAPAAFGPPDLLAVNTLRTLSIDAVEKANSGHPGLPLGAAPMAYVLWRHFLNVDAKHVTWANRDRFVLSAGHGSALLYSLLHLAGFDVSLDDLKQFRQWGAKTPGHPEFHDTPGVEATTGPLGQGTANAVGMALAERMLATMYNRPGFEIVNHRTWALVGDGDLMEGIAYEAASLAGHWKLGKLTYLYDANDVTLDGPASLIFTEDVAARFVACGWHVETVAKGDDDLAGLANAMTIATTQEKPTLIIVKTTIGFGSPKKQGSCASHGSPLGASEVAATKRTLGWDEQAQFLVPPAAREEFATSAARGAAAHAAWNELFAKWGAAHPELLAQWRAGESGTLTSAQLAALPGYDAGKAIATRTASGQLLGKVAELAPWLVGGDADLGGSTKTIVAGGDFDGARGRNVRFGVREHAMGAIANGICYHGGLRPYTSTFFVFSDYLRPAVRLAALGHLPQLFIWTHDSVGLGEDGPTHQPVEQLASLRAMPGLITYRPADANETLAGWRIAMAGARGPVALVLSRQDLPVVSPKDTAGAERGAYVLRDAADPKALILATGSEVAIALGAAEELASAGIAVRVVSMPSWELFAAQPVAYREQVLPRGVTARVSLEAGTTFGWHRWVGDRGIAIGVDRFGASAPGPTIYEKFGLTQKAVVDAVKSLL
ncbi:MAG: transketolase [Myxococcales bacterium]|nr:transketolase [Myxococcales bacterium]